jgi:hypothetical protein
MWVILLATALAGAPPRDEIGRVRTSAGMAGPGWGVWGDFSVNPAQRLAFRGGLELPIPLELPRAYGLAEILVGPYWLEGFFGGGGTLALQDGLGWRVEAGIRPLIRWGTGIEFAVTWDGDLPNGRVGAWMAW